MSLQTLFMFYDVMFLTCQTHFHPLICSSQNQCFIFYLFFAFLFLFALSLSPFSLSQSLF